MCGLRIHQTLLAPLFLIVISFPAADAVDGQVPPEDPVDGVLAAAVELVREQVRLAVLSVQDRSPAHAIVQSTDATPPVVLERKAQGTLFPPPSAHRLERLAGALRVKTEASFPDGLRASDQRRHLILRLSEPSVKGDQAEVQISGVFTLGGMGTIMGQYVRFEKATDGTWYPVEILECIHAVGHPSCWIPESLKAGSGG